MEIYLAAEDSLRLFTIAARQIFYITQFASCVRRNRKVMLRRNEESAGECWLCPMVECKAQTTNQHASKVKSSRQKEV